MKDKLINPFKYIAGFKALLWGLLAIILTSVFGYITKTHYPTIIDVKIPGPDFPVWYYLLQNISNWLVFSLLLYLLSLVVSPSSVRIIDVFGTQALARSPYLLTSFMGLFNNTLVNLIKEFGAVSYSMKEIVFIVLISVFSLLILIWMIVLMYNAFSVSANLRGTKAAVLFTLSLITAYFVTLWLTKTMVQTIFT